MSGSLGDGQVEAGTGTTEARARMAQCGIQEAGKLQGVMTAGQQVARRQE